MSETRRLDGRQARLLEVLTGIADDLQSAAAYVDLIVQAEDGSPYIEAWWTAALVRYGRCFGQGVPPWGAREVMGELPDLLQRRHRHFKRLRDTLVSHPGGIDRTYGAGADIGADGRPHLTCDSVPMFAVGRLEAMDLAELLAALQAPIQRRRIEVHNELQASVFEMSEEEFRELPQSDYGREQIQWSTSSTGAR